MSRRDQITHLQNSNQRLREQLQQTRSDLGAALGIALVALEDPTLAARQLHQLVETARRVQTLQEVLVLSVDDLAPHWRTTAAVLALKNTTTGPGPDATDGGAR